MSSRASMEMLARGLQRSLPRARSASRVLQSEARSVQVLVAARRVAGGALGAEIEIPTNANAATRVVVGGAALVAALALLRDDATRCESLEDGAGARSKYFDEDYEPSQLVGSGSFGMVMQCVSKRDGHVAAVKMIQDVNDIREEVARETEALASIQRVGGHENIVRYDGSYEHDGFHYIVTEFVEGESLYSFIQKHRQLDVNTAMQLTSQMAEALAFLRAQNLIHRDLKPANIMVQPAAERALQLKIIDFGSAERFTGEPSAKPKQAMTLSGTRCYWPPEVLENQETTPAMDMWALGCILYIMLAGRHPFDMMGTSSEAEIVQRVVTDKVSFLHPVWADVPSSVKSLIRGLLEKDPKTRLSVEEVLVHPAMRVVH